MSASMATSTRVEHVVRSEQSMKTTQMKSMQKAESRGITKTTTKTTKTTITKTMTLTRSTVKTLKLSATKSNMVNMAKLVARQVQGDFSEFKASQPKLQ